jgi:ribosomal protein S18 acetylase RimI-like enzyme
MTVTVRRIGPKDAELLRGARLRALSDSPAAFGQSLSDAASQPLAQWTTSARQAAIGNRRAWFLAELRDDGATPGPAEVVGIVLGRRRPPATLMVFSMWVDPARRRLGIGRRLIDAVEDWAREWGATSTVLWVLRDNEPAIHFYDRIGFSIEPSGPDAEAGSPRDAFAMRRAIAAR